MLNFIRNSFFILLGTIFTTALFINTAEAADTISGKTLDGSAPLAGVKVTLLQKNLSDTTDAYGAFAIVIPSAGAIMQLSVASPGVSFQSGMLHVMTRVAADFSMDIFSVQGSLEKNIFAGPVRAGENVYPLQSSMAGMKPGIHLLGISLNHSYTFAKITWAGGVVGAPSAFRALSDIDSKSNSVPAFKAAAASDTMTFYKSGYFMQKLPLQSLTTQTIADVVMVQDKVRTGSSIYDQYDQFLLNSTANNGLDPSMAMVLKAMIVIESSFNAKAISMWDTQLPCGTHSYGLIQVTPGCERGYATLPGGTPITATISGGLNGVAAKLTYANPADQTSGNTVVEENGIIIDLVSNPANPLYETSGFNPAYSIDFGAKAVASVMRSMKANYPGCSEANYVSMTLAGYNQGEGTVSGCTSFNANGQTYANNVLTQYRKFCQSGGITPIY